ncbi:MAG: IclR family transcriptional regulator [Victivallaceae bacterium]|nr:IclR family transcriptional regulator [Victivallaceae bacterium]
MNDGEKSFHKLFDIVELTAGARTPRSAQEIASELSLPVSTVYRMLKFLTGRGYLTRGAHGYLLGSGCLHLGRMAQEQNLLLSLARPVLARLADETLETVHLAQRQEDRIVYVDKFDGRRSVRMGSMIGRSGPMHCTGIGKALLAAMNAVERDRILKKLSFERYTEKTITDGQELRRELELTRRRGYALDDCEHEEGVYCIAAAVRGSDGSVAAGISIAGSPIYLAPHREELAVKVCAAAAMLSAKL